MVTWSEGEEESADIYYRIYKEENGEWKWLASKVAAPKLRTAHFPQLALDSYGNIHMAYMDGTSKFNRDIYYSKYTNGKWSSSERIYFSHNNSAWPRIAVDNDNTVYVAWYHEQDNPDWGADIIICWKKEGGDKWQGPENASRGTLNERESIHPDFKVSNGNLYVCWQDDYHSQGNWNIYYNEKINGKWKEQSKRLFPGANQYWPSLALDDDDNVHIIYVMRNGNIYYTRKKNDQWELPKVISNGYAKMTFPFIKRFHNNTLHAVWPQATGEGQSVFYARGTPDGNWLTPIKVADGGNAEFPVVDIDDKGTAHVVWVDRGRGNKRDIWYAKVTPPGNPPSASISVSATSGVIPLTIEFDASGSSDSDGQIISYHWIFGDGSKGKGEKVSHTYQKKGTYTAKLYVTDNDLLIGSKTVEIEVFEGPYPPINVKVDSIVNKSLFYDEHVNKITWSKNPQNEGLFNIVKYKVYRKKKDEKDEMFAFIGDVDKNTFEFMDRGFTSKDELDDYDYAVTAVDDQNRESPKAKTNTGSNQIVERNIIKKTTL
jgi:hypothetical protein